MRELDKVLDQSEKVVWEGTPSFWPFVLGRSIPTVLFGLVWMLFVIAFFFTSPLGVIVLFTPHFWIGIFMIFGPTIYGFLVYKHTHYAITDKRVIFQKGWIGRDFEMVDFDQMTNAEVNVGLVDKLFGHSKTGSILISTAGSLTYTRRGAVQKPYVLNSISDPYEVFKFLKKVSHDVKTDIQYPNQLRPDVNPGYKTNLPETK